MAAWVSLLCVGACLGQDPDGYPRLMQGPMLGAVEADGAWIWMRLGGEYPVEIAYAEHADFRDERRTEPVVARKDENYCLTVRIPGLAPATTYYYRIVVDGGPDKYQGGKPPFHFRTAPKDGEGARFSIGYGSCARWQREPLQPIWPVVELFAPDLFYWLGDNVYADTLDPAILGEEFQRQREVPHLWRFLASVPQLGIWDDHDYALNNHDRTNPLKAEALEIWKRYWPNPSHGLPDVPGIFFKYTYGGVDFFFLDGRYYRDPNDLPDGPSKTMLGAEQKAWLKAGLKASDSPFKVLVSGSVWTRGKGMGGDAWSSFLHERDALFDWIMEEGITGVVLMSGDTHTAELNVMRWSERGGYDLYDLTSSPLAQEPEDGWLFRDVEMRVRLPYDLGPNFGLIDFDLTVEDPTLTFRIISLEAKSVWEPLVLRASELRPGKSTWSEKQSGKAARWMRQFREGYRPE